MKKTLIALAVLATAATSANATVVYEKDGTKIDLDGRVGLQIANHTGKRTDLVDKGSRVRVRGYQDLGSGFTALANIEIRFTSSGTIGDGVKTQRLFAGISHTDVGSLSFGRQLVVGDHIGLSDYTYELGAIVKVTDSHAKAIHFMSNEFAGFRFGADYLFGTANKDEKDGDTVRHTADNGQGFNLGAFYKTKLGDVGFAIEGGYGEVTKGKFKGDKYKHKLAGAATELSFGPVALGFDWAQARAEKNHADHTFRVGPQKYAKLNQFEVGAKYQFTEANKVYAEYLWGKGKTEGKNDGKFTGWFLGVDHQFGKRAVIYLEGGSFKTKEAGVEVNKEKRIAVGTRIYF